MRRRTWAGVATAVVAAGLVGGSVLVIGGRPSAAGVDASPTDAAVTSADPTASTPPPPALRVLSVAHAAAATAAADLGAVTVTFSAPVGATVTPSLTPSLTGAWTHPTPTTAVFSPTQVPLPGQVLTVTVPAGVVGTAGGRLAVASRTSWTTRPGDPARLQQLLGVAGYLPLSFTPAVPTPRTTAALAATVYAPVAGSYAWRFTAPAALRALYTGARSSLLTRGAVLSFQAQHGLATDGVAGPQVWSALIAAVADGSTSARAYTYVLVSKSRPESLVLYRNGAPILTTPVNTGVARAATPDGSWAVFARYQSQTMSGTNPDGSHYADPGVPWISYFLGGDAVHGFPRSSYGSPQSVGCVELPIATADRVWHLMGYGDIVTVQG